MDKTTDTKVTPDLRSATMPARADVGRRLAELEERLARAQAALDGLTDAPPRMQFGSSPRMKAGA